jgi:hypothetical protein
VDIAHMYRDKEIISMQTKIFRGGGGGGGLYVTMKQSSTLYARFISVIIHAIKAEEYFLNFSFDIHCETSYASGKASSLTMEE